MEGGNELMLYRKAKKEELKDIRNQIIVLGNMFFVFQSGILIGVYTTTSHLKCHYRMATFWLAAEAGALNLVALFAMVIRATHILGQLYPKEGKPPLAKRLWTNVKGWFYKKFIGGNGGAPVAQTTGVATEIVVAAQVNPAPVPSRFWLALDIRVWLVVFSLVAFGFFFGTALWVIHQYPCDFEHDKP